MNLKTVSRSKSTKPVSASRSKLSDPVDKLLSVAEWSQTCVVGRSEVARVFLLATVAGTNMLIIGPPGIAKTMTVQLISQSFASKPGDVFDVLLTKFSKPTEIFGPLSLEALKAGEVRYNTSGFLPSATVGILDEIWKASSAILNALLRLANERTFQNGKVCERTPVRTLVGMSNEFPEEPGLLAAIFDRFPAKLMLRGLDTADFREMLTVVSSGEERPLCPFVLTAEDLAEIDRRVKSVSVKENAVESLVSVREVLKSKGVVVSDRRFVQAIRLMKASAVLAHRNEVTRDDLRVLKYVLWNTEADIAVVDSVLTEAMNPCERDLRSIADEVYAERGRVIKSANLDKADPNRPSPDFVTACGEAAKALNKVRTFSARLEVVADLVQTDSEREMFSAAAESIAAIESTLKDLCLSNPDAISRLVATQKQDI